MIRAWREIGESLHRAGVRKLVIVNSHGGNISPLDIVARELRVRLGMPVVVVSWNRFGDPDRLYGPGEKVHAIHAGEAETSLMMAFRPESMRREEVRREEVRNFVPNAIAIAEEFAPLRVTQPIGPAGWRGTSDPRVPWATRRAARPRRAKPPATAGRRRSSRCCGTCSGATSRGSRAAL